MKKEYCRLIDALLNECDPKRVLFVIGSSLKAYEKYLLKKNQGKFEVYAFVPSNINKNEYMTLQKEDVYIRVAIEPSRMGTYKSIAYEIFKRRDSILLALDGNSSAVNLIQEAKNAKYKCRTYVNPHASMLKKKADTLMGYVTMLDDSNIVEDVLKYIHVR